jgi:hypothetical protein
MSWLVKDSVQLKPGQRQIVNSTGVVMLSLSDADKPALYRLRDGILADQAWAIQVAVVRAFMKHCPFCAII